MEGSPELGAHFLNAEQLKQAGEALTAGGFGAVAMAQHLLGLATKNPQVSLQGAAAVTDNAGVVSLQGHTPVTKEDYRAEYRKIVQKYGIQGAAKSDELKQLNARVIR